MSGGDPIKLSDVDPQAYAEAVQAVIAGSLTTCFSMLCIAMGRPFAYVRNCAHTRRMLEIDGLEESPKLSARRRARRRALRAAQVVTIALALGTGGCGDDDTGNTDWLDSGTSDDTGTMMADTGTSDDTGTSEDTGTMADTGSADTGTADTGTADTGMADAATDAMADATTDATTDAMTDASDAMACEEFPPITEECCDLAPGGFWDVDSGRCLVAVPGPFVPPSMLA